MKILGREEIDIKQWNSLVDRTEGSSFFSYSWYLDAVAENWCCIVNNEYTKGMALPYSKRLGKSSLYTPIFIRYIEELGEGLTPQDIELVKNQFPRIHVCLKSKALGDDFTIKNYQKIEHERKIGSQAKRMLNKAEKSGFKVSISTDFSKVLQVVKGQLFGKIEGLNEKSFDSLEKLMKNARKADVLAVYEFEKGGIVCLEKESKALYLKGTVEEDYKKKGGMYFLMNHFIEQSIEKNRMIDFGGSNQDGVARFNKNLGGLNNEYYEYKIGEMPIWFKFARTLRKVWKK